VADLAEVVGQQAPTDPTFHASFAVVAAAIQPESAFEEADPAFDTRPPAVGSSKRAAVSQFGLVHLRLLAGDLERARQQMEEFLPVLGADLVRSVRPQRRSGYSRSDRSR
jgi:hypothetical protein